MTWQRRLYSTCGINSKNLPLFSRVHLKKKLEHRSKDDIWELRVLSPCSMNCQSLSCFSGIDSLKKKKFENWGKDWLWQLRIYSAYGINSHNLPSPFFLEFIEIKIEDRVQDWIWKLRMYSTYGVSFQNEPRFFGIYQKKRNIRDVPSYNSISALEYILFMTWIVVFLEFSENNEKSGKDYTQQVGICFICRMNCPILPHFWHIPHVGLIVRFYLICL